MDKIWIAGAGGKVGTALSRIFDNTNHELFCTDINEVDVTQSKEVELFAIRNRPDIIINCAGITNLRDCSNNPDLAYMVNTIGARNLAVQAQVVNAKFFQLSSDDVFAGGENEKYNEFDVTDAIDVYGKSKIAAEELVKNLINKYFIIRSSWVYGSEKDYVNIVCEALRNNDNVRASTTHTAVPTSALCIANVINSLINTTDYGIYHVTCKGNCTRYEFACEIASILGYSTDKIIPVKTIQKSTLLDNMMLRLNRISEPGDWKDELKRYLLEKEDCE